MTTGAAPLTIAIHALGGDERKALAADVRRGLLARPKVLPPRWFYDERGSELFEEITELDEYYQTRTERAILEDVADRVMSTTGARTLVEIGAGSCAKTRVLIDAGRRAGTLERFVPFDVSAALLQRAARSLVEDFPGLLVYAVVGEFCDHLPHVPRFERQLLAFLGSTIGNFDDAERADFLRTVRALLAPGDAFLLGVDLVKDERELVAAYDDARGVTAAFNRNVLEVVNRQLGAAFEPDAFDHVAIFNRDRSRIEMHLRARREMAVEIPGARMVARFAAGETVRTEISVKFRREALRVELGAAGLTMRDWLTDGAGRFALALAVVG